jgi:hypothetical protein
MCSFLRPLPGLFAEIVAGSYAGDFLSLLCSLLCDMSCSAGTLTGVKSSGAKNLRRGRSLAPARHRRADNDKVRKIDSRVRKLHWNAIRKVR